ncbi:4'-phosphopantetheinyl transferase family protein [Kitasatospora sp. LaBMicrA B282]|uniref:4'-phosphopantetheinyl transferase family protein n=1 Tax=Kitasatospora sp. LaBMicrA B282 TaxID=3420949 RepID=UPI003D1052ED
MTARVQAEVWFVDLDAFAARPGLAALLDRTERARLGRIAVPRAARRYTAAHAALRLITAAHCGVPADRIRWTATRHGKPLLAPIDQRSPRPLQVNLSHSAGLAAIALAPGRPIGVDLERLGAVPPRVPAGLRHWPAPADPAAFFRYWTRLEACVKATGARLTDGLTLPVADLTGPGGPIRATGGPLAGHHWHLRDLTAPAGYAAAVALTGDAAFTVRARHWPLPTTPVRPPGTA